MATMMHLLKYLWGSGVKFRVVGKIPTYLSQHLDAATHIPESIRARTILMKADCEYWMVVVPKNNGIDERKLRRALGVKNIKVVAEEELETVLPHCKGEAIPTFGDLYGFPVIVEKSLSEKKEIAFNACSSTDFIVMKYEDYQQLTRPIIAEFAAPSSYDKNGTTVRSISAANNIEQAATKTEASGKTVDAVPASNKVALPRNEVQN